MFVDSIHNNAPLFLMMNDSFEADKTFPDYMSDKGVEMWAMKWEKLWLF